MMAKTESKHAKNKELLIKYLTTNDKSAYDELFVSNVNLVRHFINKNIIRPGKTQNETMEEYFDIGCMGLHKAIVNFKLERVNKIQFATYAIICIRNEIYMEFRKEKKHNNEVSLESAIGNDTEDLKLEDVLFDDSYRPDEVIEEKYYQEYKKQKIASAIAKLNSKSRKILELFYGFDGEKRTLKEVAEILDLSPGYVNKILISIRAYLKQELEEFDLDYRKSKKNAGEHRRWLNVTKEDDEQDIDTKKFGKRGALIKRLYATYSKDKVASTIDTFEEKENRLLKMYFGIKPYDMAEISKISKLCHLEKEETSKLIIKNVKILENILKGKKPLRITNKMEHLLATYTLEEINDAIEKLSTRQKELINLRHSESRKENISICQLSILTSLKKANITNTLISAYKNIEKNILKQRNKQEEKIHVKRKNKKELLIETYGLELITQTVSTMSENDQKVLNLYFDEAQKSRKEIAEILNLDYIVVTGLIYNSLNRLVSKLSNSLSYRLAKLRGEKLKKNYDTYGKSVIDRALLELEDIKLQAVIMYYGLNNEKPLPREEICKKLNIDTSILSEYLKEFNDLIKKKEKKAIEKSTPIDELYALYGVDKVNEAILTLSNKMKDILTLYYGLNGQERLSAKEISNKLGYSVTNITTTAGQAIKRIEKLINNPKDKRDDKLRKLNDLYNTYGKEKVLNKIAKLNDQAKKILSLYFGLDGSDAKTPIQISETLNISPTKIYNVLYKSIPRLEGKLNKTNKYNIKDLFDKYGKETILDLINSLDDKTKKVLKLYFGIDTEIKTIREISIMINIEYYNASNMIARFVKNIDNLLSKSTNAIYKRDDLLEKYSKEELESLANKLSKKRKLVMTLVYGLYGTSPLKVNEVASRLNVTTATIYNSISQSKRKIEEITSNNGNVNTDAVKIKNQHEENTILKETKKQKSKKKSAYEALCDKYGNDVVYEAISKLKVRQKEIYSLYYGIEIERKSPKEIAQLYNITINTLTVTIYNINVKLRKNFNKQNNNSKENEIKKPIIESSKEESSITEKEIDSKGKIYRKEEIYSSLMIDDDKVIEEAISRLPKRKQDLVKIYYGHALYPMLTIEQISRKLNVDEFFLTLSIEQVLADINNELVDMEEEKLTSDELKIKRKKEFISSLIIKDKELIRQSIKKLSIDEYNVVSLYYGISNDVHTLNNIARITSLSKKRIKDIVKRTINKINNMLIKKK